MGHALISIKPEYVRSILNGSKSIEVRRGPLKLATGTKLWIYSTSPSKCVEAVVEVRRIARCTPSSLWQKFQKALCISKLEFDRYVMGCKEVTAIFLGEVVRLRNGLSLHKMRALESRFHPPQFFLHLDENRPILEMLTRRLATL